MPLSSLQDLASKAPVRICLIHGGSQAGLGFAGLLQVLRLTADYLGPQRVLLDVVAWDAAMPAALSSAPHLVLLVADQALSMADKHAITALMATCRAAVWGAVGAAVEWLARSGELNGRRAALPPSLDAHAPDLAGLAVVSRSLYELEGDRLTCCGGAASLDFALSLVQAIFGHGLQNEIMHALCISHVREGCEQRGTLAERTADLPPALSEALQLMEANIEEPLTTDDIAGLVDISRRQLERLFKQYLDNMPARYYLGLRLRRARQLLLESHHSIVQVGLMCGFSSGAHFATAYGTLFGLTPREERQRKLSHPA